MIESKSEFVESRGCFLLTFDPFVDIPNDLDGAPETRLGFRELLV